MMKSIKVRNLPREKTKQIQVLDKTSVSREETRASALLRALAKPVPVNQAAEAGGERTALIKGGMWPRIQRKEFPNTPGLLAAAKRRDGPFSCLGVWAFSDQTDSHVR